jgi:hypothetical protein
MISKRVRWLAAWMLVLRVLSGCGKDTPPILDNSGETPTPDDPRQPPKDASAAPDAGDAAEADASVPDAEVDSGPPPRPIKDASADADAGPCVPMSPTEACQSKCGNVPDGCGGFLPCGATCGFGQLCDAQSNVCRTPRASCEDYGAECGLLANDCGGQTNCGTCPDDAFGNRRECDAKTLKCRACPSSLSGSFCSTIGYQCGAVERCGMTVNCGTCPDSTVCDAVSHTCVTAFTASCAGKCGPISNGQGGIVQCGSCPPGQACGAGGVPSVCAPSKPRECAAVGVECGPLTSQCGAAQLNCGDCPSGQVCRSNGTCGNPCTPITCEQAGAQCGFVSDGCGKLLNCGACSNGSTCNPNTNQCCQPLTCAANYAGQCGLRGNGCGGTLKCNPCGGGQVCTSDTTCCTPKTCDAYPGQCGTFPDGCGGGVISCGCSGGKSCIAGTCQTCTPRTCAANYPGQCGTFSNGCGGSITCSCSGNQTCGGGGTQGVCGCLNAATCPAGFVGPLQTCTGTIYCGT